MPLHLTRRTPLRLPAVLAAVLGLCAAVIGAAATLAPRAEAATLTPVSAFGANPGDLNMYAYVPDTLPDGAPLVVLLHGCSQDAAAYHRHSGWAEYADRLGFALVYAEQRRSNHSSTCFHWFRSGDTARDSGEALSIRNMVAHAVRIHGLDEDRVYVSGLSAGGAMASEMLSAYPDVFAAGSIVAGLPTGCATSLLDATTCMYAGKNRTPEQWGDLVRAKNPGWTGPWPRVAVWHGTSDSVVVPANAASSRDQWTDVWGIGRTPAETGSLGSNTTVEIYRTDSGVDAVARYTVSGMGHGTPVAPGTGDDRCGTAGAYFLDTICSTYHTIRFWGLGEPPEPSPTPTATPTANPSPTTPPPPSGECVTADNYRHVAEGRAYVSYGQAYSEGGDDLLGLWNVYVTTSLRETSPHHWERVTGC
ncbi:PHB depolymerase family esterase [Thermobifida halotolerans]|uniref:PHB depolymerase family esterase n=1 Tax=Thermobifida halotolerans TaxID=483545 RepID=A0A399G295_9ACTN|nr:PHB depolymerase family esterase [Thermobifida halotolerans]UOE19144.1 PHB depolymerase family esterase [Thermobifida halotolerans]